MKCPRQNGYSQESTTDETPGMPAANRSVASVSEHSACYTARAKARNCSAEADKTSRSSMIPPPVSSSTREELGSRHSVLTSKSKAKD